MANIIHDRKDKPITIVGCGLSGLVAAIHLTRIGIEVVIYENKIENKNDFTIHTSRFHMDKVCDYLDLDLTGYFSFVEEETAYLFNKRIEINSKAYACERGSNEGSLDSFLRRLAVKKGVVFENREYKLLRINNSDATIILATGLRSKSYDILNIKKKDLYGFEARMEYSDKVTLTSYKDWYTNNDYAYMASMNNKIYTLLFSRDGLDDSYLQEYQDILLRTKGISFPEWNRIRGSVPLEGQLFRGNYILSGTLSGMIDPFFLSGVIAALISGKISAWAVIDNKKAIKEYDYLHRNFNIKTKMLSWMMSNKIPNWIKKYIIYVHTVIKDVGKL